MSRITLDIFSSANLPDTPGVYLFKDANDQILYIGRATSLYDRVRSYFARDLFATRGQLLVDMVARADKIEHIETDSVLEAIILEAQLIKEHQPYYNTKEKDNRSYNYVVITGEEFPRLLVVRGRNLDIVRGELANITESYKIRAKFGPYPEGGLLRDALKIIRKIFPYRDAKADISHQNRFYQSLGLSPQVDSPESKKEYQKIIWNLILFFKGKKTELLNSLEKDMRMYAKKREFEKASNVKRVMHALMHIQDVALIKHKESHHGISKREMFRVEAFDVAHMSGKNVVGVMTVIYADDTGGNVEKGEYRKFRLTQQKNDDVGSLKEILIRRFNHSEWSTPNLIVIDGGLLQKQSAEQVLKDIGVNVPVVSVVKDRRHKPHHFLGDEGLVNSYKKIILHANAEAHRFAIAYHKNLRKRTFLGKK